MSEAGRPGDWRQHYPDYLGCCASLDDNVARLRDQLEADGLWDNTLVIYTADHGCHFRTRNDEYKRSCHDASLRVPLIVRGPNRDDSPFTGGKVIDELVSLIDLPPTVVTAGGGAVPPAMRGRGLQPLAAGNINDQQWGDDVFAQISEAESGRAVRTARWTYGVVCPDGDPAATSPQRYVETYLYDNQADPHQLVNRVADPSLADVRADLAARLRRHMRHACEPEPTIEAAGV
jgi:arylsulfatase A-like enzyme